MTFFFSLTIQELALNEEFDQFAFLIYFFVNIIIVVSFFLFLKIFIIKVKKNLKMYLTNSSSKNHQKYLYFRMNLICSFDLETFYLSFILFGIIIIFSFIVKIH